MPSGKRVFSRGRLTILFALVAGLAAGAVSSTLMGQCQHPHPVESIDARYSNGLALPPRRDLGRAIYPARVGLPPRMGSRRPQAAQRNATE